MAFGGLMKRIFMLSALLGASLVASTAWADYDCDFKLKVVNQTSYDLYIAPRLGADGQAVSISKGASSSELVYTASSELLSRQIQVFTVSNDVVNRVGVLKYKYDYRSGNLPSCVGVRQNSLHYVAEPNAPVLKASAPDLGYPWNNSIVVTLTGG